MTPHRASNADALEITKDGFALVCIINFSKCILNPKEHIFIIGNMFVGMCH